VKKALIIFAREPIPGKVKTRLALDVGEQAAAEIYAAMLADVLEKAVSLDNVRPLVFWALETGIIPDHTEFSGLETFEQHGTDLGDRMANAFTSAFSLGIDACCCIGSDLPDLPADYIRQAFRDLESPETDIVFGPAEDGGYYLVGMKKTNYGLFANVAWSTPRVLATSLERARESELTTRLLPAWYDIDLIGDLRRLASSPGQSAPRTRSVISNITELHG
jgi:rSAM/selenodomain-associated transferase 1